MMKHKMLATAVFAVMAALSARAGVTSTLTKTRLSAKSAVQLGRWHASLSKCKAYAVANGVPLIAVWSNGDVCGHCVMFEKACNTSVFKTWMASSGCVFLFVHSGDSDGGQGKAPYNFCYKNQTTFPFVRVYWPKGKVDVYAMGDTVDGKTSNGKTVVNWFKNKLKNYKYTPVAPAPAYNGGEFGVPDSEQARLEAEVGLTTCVTLPLSRTNSVASASASTNTVVATYPDGSVVTNVVIWDEGDDSASIAYDTSSLANAGDRIELVVLDATGKAVGTNHITAVAEVENSPKNPYWLGEKTAETLDWGEWTMDLDAATNKVRAFNAAQGGAEPLSSGRPKLLSAAERAYTMVLIGGSMWCPDCSAADYNCFDREEFKTWAKEKKLALVVVDIPNLPNGTASLLSYVTSRTSDRYITANYTPGYSNEAMRVQSGTGYLSRHMIPQESDDGITNATAVAARNAWLVGHNTLEGGWNRPERANQNRTGVPVLLVLRDDGTIAARFNRFSDVGPTFWTDGYLRRFEEMLAQAAEPAEESNDSYMTTTETIGKRDALENKSISFQDALDVYRLDPADTNGRRMKFTFSGETDALVEARLIAYGADGTAATVASASGSLKDGIDVAGDIDSTNCFLSVGWLAESSYPADVYFAHTNEASTVCAYSLKSDFVVKPAEVAETVSVGDGLLEMSFALESNKVYRITGLDASANAEFLTPVDGVPDRYTALVTDDVTLKLAAGEVECQIWNPGKIGFATPSAFAAESAGVYEIRLARTGGVSGTASVKIGFDAARSSKLDGLVVLPADLEETRTWTEGDAEEKTIAITIVDNPFADGDQALYFTATVDGGDAEPGIVELRLTLRDNDKPVAGKLEISATDPSIAKGMNAFARAGDDLSITLGRVGGADSDLSATLSASAGALDETSFSWPTRDTADRTATLALPSATGRVKVTLTPAKGTAVNTSRRILTVDVLDAGAPGFEQGAVAVSAVRYAPVAETRVGLDGMATDATTVKAFSGALPPGMKWTFDKETKELAISGVPSKAGEFTATYRAYNGSKGGLVTEVTVTVTDPVADIGATGAPLNASVAKSRTFADVPVFDEASKRLAGTLTLTVPRTGRLSGKYRTADGTVSLSCASWNGTETDGTNMTLFAGLAGAFGTNRCELAVAARPDGTVALELSDPRFTGETVKAVLDGADAWTKANPATDYKGYYTVSLSQKAETRVGNVLASGDGYVTLKMDTAAALNAGKVTYAGILPNGRPFSGAATLGPDKAYDAETGEASSRRPLLPLLSVSSQDTLAGAVKFTPGAADPEAMDLDEKGEYCTGRCSYRLVRRSVHPADEGAPAWRHFDVSADVSYETELDAHGTYYNSAEDFASCCDAALGTTKLTFFSLPWLGLPEEVTDALAAGAAETAGVAAVAGVNVTYAKATSKAKTKTNGIATADAKKLTLSFTLATGVVSGTFAVPFEGETKTVTYRCVVMPGWGSQECGDCGLGGKEAAYRPFISGTAWFNDAYEYVDAAGRARKATVRRSCPVSVGVNAGE